MNERWSLEGPFLAPSQLAIEYAYRTRKRSPETWVFWVHASNAARFEQSFRDIANCVKISGRQNPQANIFQLVHDWLCSDRNGEWVLILDNVDDAGFLVKFQSTGQDGHTNSVGSGKALKEYLPYCSNGSILITTRTKVAALELVEDNSLIEVKPMGNLDAVALLEKKLRIQGDSDTNGKNSGLGELAAALEFMPLAIVQAAAYISQRAPRCSVSEYLDKFRKSDYEKTSLLDNKAGHLRRDREAKNSIIITWHISFEHIRQSRPSAADLLSLMSLCDRQGIPETLIRRQVEVKKSLQKKHSEGIQRLALLFHRNRDRYAGKKREITSHEQIGGFDDDMLLLRNYSFVSISESQSTFEMHALVQLAMRTWMETNGQLEQWKQRYFKIFCAEFPTGEYKNWSKCQELFPHALSAVLQQPEEEDSLRDWASILYKAAWYAWSIGKGVEAEKMSVQAMKVRKRILGQKHEDTLCSMEMVGLAYVLRGKYDAAEPLYRETLQLREKILGKEHPDTLASIKYLAVCLESQGKYDAAEAIHRLKLN